MGLVHGAIYFLAIYFLIFIVFSFVGWFGEMIITFLQVKHFYNRGFLIGPICPVYGVGGVLITLALSGVNGNLVATFCVGAVIGAILEYLTSYWMEKLFHVRWWDYSQFRFNVNGRICLHVTACFGLCAVLLVCFIHPHLLNILTSLPELAIYVTAGVLFALFVTDVWISLVIMNKFKVTAGTVAADASEEIRQNIRKVLDEQNSKLQKRLFKAFPDLKIHKK